MFLLRLCSSYNGYLDSSFISDVINLLRKYDLFYVSQDYVLHGRFPTKCIWKIYLNTRISSYFVNEWNERTTAPEFEIYRQIQQQFSVSPVWHLAKRNQSILSLCFSVAQMIAFRSTTDSTCSRCGITDITCCIPEHILVNCNCDL